MNLYVVEVYSAGEKVTEYEIASPTGLDACNRIENEYFGGPPTVTIQIIQKDSKTEKRRIVSDWHGYTFQARLKATINAAGGEIITKYRQPAL